MLLLAALVALLTAPAYAELIVNGDFQAGNQGFITEYKFSPGNIDPAQSYDVAANPFPVHGFAVPYFDHTLNTPAGKMLVVNEANVGGVLVWGQTVPVTPATDYTFTGYISSWGGVAPTKLDVRFNGRSIGVMQAPTATGIWAQFTATWNSGAANAAIIELRNVAGADIGGDFALDDLSLDGPRPGAALDARPETFASGLAVGLLLGCVLAMIGIGTLVACLVFRRQQHSSGR
jgi:hypothetical protein